MISCLKGPLVLCFALEIAFKEEADQGMGFYAQIFFLFSFVN